LSTPAWSAPSGVLCDQQYYTFHQFSQKLVHERLHFRFDQFLAVLLVQEVVSEKQLEEYLQLILEQVSMG